MTNINSWLPSVVAVLLAVIGTESSQIQAFIGNHHNLDAILGALAVIVSNLHPSPLQSQQPQAPKQN